MSKPVPVSLPCCHRHEVLVTGRASKQRERPRYHVCRTCGQLYAVDARSGVAMPVHGKVAG